MPEDYGKPRVARFSGGARSAVSLEFDDAMPSQVEHAVPLLRRYGFRGTFFITPGFDHYPALAPRFEVDLPAQGHEIGNHTWTHRGARTKAELADEVARCERVLRRIYGKRPRLKSFAQPGGVPWEVTPEAEREVFRQNRLILARPRYFFDDRSVHPISLLQPGEWRRIGFHGIGGEWLPTQVAVLNRLLDHLKRHAATIWTAPSIEIFKYERERDAARLHLTPISPSEFTLRLTCDPKKLETYGHPIATLWDQALTIEVQVPPHWRRFKARQSGRTFPGRVSNGIARFHALPNRGPIRVTSEPLPLKDGQGRRVRPRDLSLNQE